jgi:hypothetical protein
VSIDTACIFIWSIDPYALVRLAGGCFSPHANTHLHANDRQALERMCRDEPRGVLALERLSRAEDGRIAYRMNRPLPDGITHLFFTGLELLRRVASLIPPPRANLTRFGAYSESG